jgi:iron complex outermembrane recepter protein
MKLKPFYISSISLAALVLPLGSVAAANDAADDSQQAETGTDSEQATGNIIVTARLRQERLQDIPLTISAISEAQIERLNVRRVQDLLQVTPGLNFDIGGFPNDTRPSIRGMTAERGRPSVAILLDGQDLSTENLAIGGGGSALRASLFDLERIEVVRGPQSTLYGRNAFAGAISYITRKPEFEWRAVANSEFGNYGLRGVNGSLTGPIVEDLLAFRINAAHRETDGWYKHPVNGSKLGAEKSQGIAGALRLTPGAGLTIDGRYQYSKERMSDAPTAFIFANTRLPVPNGTFTAGPPGTPPQACPPSLTGLPPQVVAACTRGTVVGRIDADVSDIEMGLNPLTGLPPFGMRGRLHVGSVAVKWETESFGTFHYNFGYLNNRSQIEQDGDFHDRPAPPGMVLSIQALQELDYGNKQYNHVAYWTWSDDRFDLILGYQRFDESADLNNASQFWLRSPTSPLAGPPFFLRTAPTNNNLFPVMTTRETDYDGFFGGITVELLEGLKLGGEVRYNRDSISYASSGWRRQDVSLQNLTPSCLPGFAPGATFSPSNPAGSPPPGVIVGCPTSGTIKESRWTPRLSLQYMPNRDWMIYSSYAEGFKPGGFNSNEIVTLDNQEYLAETVKTMEFGVKGSLFDRRVNTNVAVFRNRYRDQQIGVQLTAPGAGGQNVTTAGIINAGRVNIWGIEADISARITDNLTAFVGYAYTDAKFASFVQGPPPGSPLALVQQCGVPGGQSGSAQNLAEAGNVCGDLSGNRPGNTPRHSLILDLNYSQNVSSNTRLYVDLNGQYRSQRFTDEANLAFLPSHWLAIARVGAEIGPIEVQLAVENLFNDRKIKNAQRNIDFGNPEGFAPGRGYLAYLPQPRTVALRTWVRF